MQQWARQPIFWSAVIVLMGFSFLSPMQLLTIHFAMVPIVMVISCAKNASSASIHLLVPVVLLMVLSGAMWPVTAVILAVMIVPAAAIAYMYKRGAGAVAVMTAGIVAMIAVLLTILISVTLAGIDIQAELKALMTEQFALFEQVTGTAVLSEEALNAFVAVAVKLLPLYIMIIAFYYTVITHVISRRMLHKLGLPASALPPAREWRLPRSLIWYYLIVLLLDFMTPADSGLYTFILNVYPVLLFAFAVQGVAFFFFWMHSKGRSKALPITVAILSLFFPPIMYITSMVGLFDTAFPIRQYLNKK